MIDSLQANGLGLTSVLKSALMLSAIYTLGDYLWYVALGHTSVSAATCMFDTSCIFTYVFSVKFLEEKLDVVKIVGMLTALGGAMLTAWFPGDNNSQSSNQGSQLSWLF